MAFLHFLCAALVPVCAAYNVTWHAREGDEHVRRLEGTSRRLTFTVSVNILKQDSFGSEPPRLDVSFTQGGKTYQAFFPGTDGNAGREMPHGLLHGMQATVTGHEESTDKQDALKVEMRDRVLLSTGAADAGITLDQAASKDKRPVFVVTDFNGQVTGSGARLLSHGGNARNMKAIMVYFDMCDAKLSETTTSARLENAFFSKTEGSFHSVLDECSRGAISVEGMVKGPYHACPDSNDAWAIYTAVNSYMTENDPDDWSAADYKLMVIPSSFMASIGIGTIGGGISWYMDSYVQYPVLFLHEIGHNWRLHHAAAAFRSQEYHDRSGAMGYCCSTRCFNFIHSWQLGFAEYLSVLKLSDLIEDGFLEIELPALGLHRESGVKIVTSPTDNQYDPYLVLSYRLTDQGFDRYLSGNQLYANTLQVHHWDGDRIEDAQLSHLLHSVGEGQSILIKDTDGASRLDTDLKLTFVEKRGGAAVVRLCQRLPTDDDGHASPCEDPAAVTSTTATITTTDVTITSTATSVTSVTKTVTDTSATNTFSGTKTVTSTNTVTGTSTGTFTTTASTTMTGTSTKTVSATISATTTSTMSTITVTATSTTMTTTLVTTTATTTIPANPGGPWSTYFNNEASSKEVSAGGALVGIGCKGQFCRDIKLNFRPDVASSSKGATAVQVDVGNGVMTCSTGQFATRLSCLSDSCDNMRMHCAWPNNGRITSQPHDLKWFPKELHATEESYCYDDDVAVGVQCDSAKCARLVLMCAKFEASDTCVPHCNYLGLECGDDGCGGSCGACSESVCNEDVGRCLKIVGSEWASSSQSMSKTELVSFGMGCRGRYCSEMQLIQSSLSVDGSVYMESPWISDNKGRRYFWQDKDEQADTLSGDCPDGMAVSWIECKGKRCDNVRFYCAKPLNWIVDMSLAPIITDWFSEESDGRRDCPSDTAMTGLECKKSKALWQGCIRNCGDYCDEKRLRCRAISPEKPGLANLGVLDPGELPASVSQAPWLPGPDNKTSSFFSVSEGNRQSASGVAAIASWAALMFGAAC